MDQIEELAEGVEGIVEDEDGAIEGANEPKAKRQRAAKVVSKESAQFCMKVLCNDEFTKALLGPRGSMKDSIQADSGARLVFSNKNDYFPNSPFRVLAVYANDTGSINTVIQAVILKLVECADRELAIKGKGSDGKGKDQSKGCQDMIGKERGEYVLRLCVSVAQSRAIIGPGGSSIKQLRSDFGIKLFIENETVFGHQMVRVIGPPEAILKGVEHVNEIIQGESGTQDFREWSQLVNFGELAGGEGGYDEGGRGGYREGGDQQSWDQAWTPSWEQEGRNGWRGANSAPVSLHPGVESVAELVSSLNADFGGAADLDYCITCMLPEAHAELVSGENAEYFAEVTQQTSANIEFGDEIHTDDPEWSTREVKISGPMMSIYAAHLKIMKKAQDVEREENVRANAPLIQEIKSKIDELQAQLDQVMSGNFKGIPGAQKGKSKGKGKGKGKK